MKILALVFAVVALLGFQVNADTLISTLPYTIAVTGNYSVAHSLSYSGSGAAITVNASDVTVDLQGQQLVCSTPPGTTAVGIAAKDRSNVTVRNGSILNFKRGIQVSGSTARRCIIEKLSLISCRETAIWSECRNAIIRDNVISATGSGFANGGINDGATGIYSTGLGGRIINNDVSDTHRPGAIVMAVVCWSGIVQGNRITNSVKAGVGITAVFNGLNGLNDNNWVVGFNAGIFSTGNVINRRNTCFGCGTSITGGIDGGDNQ